MPTVSRTFQFLTNSESLKEVGLDANLNLLWSPTDGNPAGCIEATSTTGGAGTQTEAMSGVLMPWYYWFAIPTYARILSLQCNSWDDFRWGGSNVTTRTWKFRFVTAGRVSVHSAGELISDSIAGGAGDGGITHANGAGTSRNVDAPYQRAATPVALEIEHSLVCSAIPTSDYEVDNLVIACTYLASDAIPPRSKHRKMGIR
jgi:hypothetical protein